MKRGREEENVDAGAKEPKLSLIEQAKKRWKTQSATDKKVLINAKAKGKWTEHKDAKGTYYRNSITGGTSRTRPADFVDTALEPIMFEGQVWKVNRAGNGELFYTNEETGQSKCKRPGEVEGITETAESKTSATPPNATKAPYEEEPDEVIDLVGRTAPSDISASDKIYARVLADSDDGVSVVGFHLRLNSPFSHLMEAWADYMELPVPSVYFEFDGKVLTAMQTPSSHGWRPELGTFKIVAKPCEEVECTDSEAEEEEEKKQLMKDKILAEWKKEQKQRRKASKAPT